MKDLNVLKKYLIIVSLLASFVVADELKDILSTNKEKLFDYDLKSNKLNSDKLSKSWINPIHIQYSKNYTTQFKNNSKANGTFSIAIDQPIFRSGGIYYAIKYSSALRRANKSNIMLQKRKMIGDAVSILFNLKKIKLQQKKMRLVIKNDEIDIRQMRNSYNAGLLDSTFLDQAILKKNLDETSLLELESTLLELKQKFSLLSDKNPNRVKLPTLKLISKSRYAKDNMDLKTKKLRAEVSSYNTKITRAKYLPTISINGQYIDKSSNTILSNPIAKDHYYNYGFTISMPIDVNSLTDIEASKVERLKAKIEVLEQKDTLQKEYMWVVNSLHILDKKIALARKNEKLYRNLYRVTKNLVKAGEKTKHDANMMYNSLQIHKLEQKIYKLDKQLNLLKLYVRVKEVS